MLDKSISRNDIKRRIFVSFEAQIWVHVEEHIFLTSQSYQISPDLLGCSCCCNRKCEKVTDMNIVFEENEQAVYKRVPNV